MARPVLRNPSIQQPAVVHSPAMSRGKQQWSPGKILQSHCLNDAEELVTLWPLA